MDVSNKQVGMLYVLLVPRLRTKFAAELLTQDCH